MILQDSRALLAELDRVLYNMFLVREKVGELAARIDWLHDDFTTELNSLVQGFYGNRERCSIRLKPDRGCEAVSETRPGSAERTAAGLYRLVLKIRSLTTCATGSMN